MNIDRNQTGIASELLVAGELARRGYDVSITLGTTKSIDLRVHKDDRYIPVQVKGMYYLKSKNWRLNKDRLKDKAILVLVILHCDNLIASPEYYLITSEEAEILFKEYDKGGRKDTYLSYNADKMEQYKDRWSLLDT